MLLINFALIQLLFLSYTSWHNYRTKNKFYGIKILPDEFILVLLNIVIFTPIVEEIIFRFMLPKLFTSMTDPYINGLIFSLYHFIPIGYDMDSNRIIITEFNINLIHCIFFWYMGYNLYEFNSLSQGIIIHIYHNFVTMILYFFINHYMYKLQSLDKLKNKTILCPTRCIDDLNITHKYIKIPESRMNPNILCRHYALSNIMDNRKTH